MNNKKNNTPSNTKSVNTKKTIKKLFNYIREYRLLLLIVIILAVISTIFSVIGPKILGNATTEIFNGIVSKYTGGKGINFDKLGRILITVLILYGTSWVLSFFQGFIMSGISKKITYKLRNEMSEKINRLPMSYFDKKGTGEVLSVITNDVDTLSQNLNQSVVQMITSVVTIIGTLIMMFSINFYMTIISIFILPVSLFAAMKVVKRSEKYFKDQQDYLGHINGKVEEMFTGHNIIKVYNAEQKVINEFEKDNEVLGEAVRKSQFLSGLMKPIMDFIGNIGYVLIAIIGGYFAVIGKITVGNIQSFISYNKTFVFPIIEFAQITNMIQAMLAGSERIFDFLESEEKKKYPSKDINVDKIKGHVTFENIRFGYNEDKIIINDFSADIKAGSKIAIVGPTGAGKTTIVKLLMRFYDLNQGKILIDGHNINSIKDADFKKIFGMVLQDTWLFSGTIMENLKYGRLDATDDEVIEMAKKVKVHHFIQTLPGGYNMMLNEDSDNISSGQKQLLTIARAVLADPKILILDEATSNVDTRTEVMLQEAMEEVMKNRTTFIIAHRLSTIKDADLILVMNNGDIVEQGNFEELMKKNGFYASIYNAQFSNVEEN